MSSCACASRSGLGRLVPHVLTMAEPPAKRRKVTVTTVNKWKAENDKALNTTAWLTFEKLDRDHVALLKCSVCARFEEKIKSCRNYNSAFVVGTANLRVSSVKDHAATEMHKLSMTQLRKSQSQDLVEYAPIAKALSTMDPDRERKVKRKFEIAYMLCKEGLAFTKMGAVFELEEKHGVDLGVGYKNNQACATFVENIAMSMREGLADVLSKAKYFSIQADGSTDTANIEDELFLVLYFDAHTKDGAVHVQSRFLTVRQPQHSDASGLYECFVRALTYAGVTGWENKLVGFGCDGASVNIAANGLRGYLEESVPWVIVFWCLAHRLELALEDALKGTLFSAVDEMLLRVYYLYKNSPKKCRELEEVIAALRMCLEPGDLPNEGGNRPLRACGTRFVSHKVAGISRLIDRYGAYLAHLTTLTEDSSVRDVDRQKLKGYVLKWRDCKMVLGCAFFHDILKPAALMCKSLQYDEVCVESAIESTLKASKVIESLRCTPFDELPTVKKVLGRVQHEGGEKSIKVLCSQSLRKGYFFLGHTRMTL